MKRFVVVALEWGCDKLDRAPWLPWPLSRRTCGMADLSARLDQRWGTGQWKPVYRGTDGEADRA